MPTSLQEEFNNVLQNKILGTWYPLVIDTIYGGYLTDFDNQWKKKIGQRKMIVTQSRHIWTLSKAAELDNSKEDYLQMAKHGVNYLKEVMWDKEFGGFYNLVEQNGTVITDQVDNKIIKQAYGNAFAIYGLSAYAKVSGDKQALQMAKDAFLWLEKHSHDSTYGGYFQFLEQNGQSFRNGYKGTPAKDQNSSIHLLEAFTELYAIWKDPLVKMRLEEMLILIRDTMVDERGFLNLFFSESFQPLSFRDSTKEIRKANFNLDHVSFGHDIETAWLLMEATESLGNHNDQLTLSKSKQMLDHGLINGYDDRIGGVYDGGYYYNDNDNIAIIKDTKNWWAQVETMNTLFYMSKLFPEDELNYKALFLQQWNYINDNLIDHEHGGFYSGGLDKEPEREFADKSQIWKGPYHTARAFMNCLKMFE